MTRPKQRLSRRYRTGERLQKQRVKAAEVPFTAERRRMTVVLRTEGGYRVITKGAPEAILPRCTYVLLNGKNVTLTPEMRAALSAKNRDMANDALRVLAAAEKRTEACPETDDAAESGLCFLGLIGLRIPRARRRRRRFPSASVRHSPRDDHRRPTRYGLSHCRAARH